MEQTATPYIVQLCLLNKIVETPWLSTEIFLYAMLDSDGKCFLGSLTSRPSMCPKPSPPLVEGSYWIPDPIVADVLVMGCRVGTWRRCKLGKEHPHTWFLPLQRSPSPQASPST